MIRSLACLMMIVVALVAVVPGGALAQAPPPTPTADVMARLKTRAEVFLFTLMSGDPSPVAGQMSPGVRNAWSADTCKSVFGDLMRQGGLLQGTDPASIAIHQNGHVIATIPVNYAKNSVAAQVVFERAAPLAKVVGFSIQPHAKAEAGVRTEGGASVPTAVGTVPSPAYAQRALFVERRLDVPATRELKLPAVVTLPTIAGSTTPVPCVLLLAGNGDFDEDGTLGASKPMRDIAHGLATLGVASIRYARRSFVDPTGMAATPSPDLAARLVADAVAAGRVLAGQREVDAKRLIVVGTDVGATIAPLVARELKAQGVVLMAPLPTPLVPYLSAQAKAVLAAGQAPGGAARAQLESAASAAERDAAGSLAADESLAGMPVSVWRELDAADPAKVLREDNRPFAVLYPGDSFLLANPADRELWTKLANDTVPMASTRTYPGLNHAFIAVEGGATFENTLATGNVAEPVVVDLASYVTLGQLTKPKP